MDDLNKEELLDELDQLWRSSVDVEGWAQSASGLSSILHWENPEVGAESLWLLITQEEVGHLQHLWGQIAYSAFSARQILLSLSDKLAIPLPAGDIVELGLSSKVINYLRRAGITTVDQLVLAGEEGIRGIYQIGPQSLKEILDALAEYHQKSSGENGQN